MRAKIHGSYTTFFVRKHLQLPWMPEIYLARFSVSVMSAAEAKQGISVRRAREKNSGTQGNLQSNLH